MDTMWRAHQEDALLGAGFKPFRPDGDSDDVLWAWVYDELHGSIADTPVWVQNTVIMLDEETRSVDLFVMGQEEWTPRTVEDIPGWKDWVG